MLINGDNWADALNSIRASDELVIDTETTGLGVLSGKDRIIGIAVLTRLDENTTGTFYFPFRHVSGNLPMPKLKELIRILNGRPLIGHNVKFDAAALYHDGLIPPPSMKDTLLAAHLANENEYVYNEEGKVQYRSDGKPRTNHALKFLADKYLGSNSSSEEKKLLALLGKGKNKGSMGTLPAEVVEPYACSDTELTLGLYELYVPILKRWRLYTLWMEFNHYASVVLKMEMRGIRIDTETTNDYIRDARSSGEKVRMRVVERHSAPGLNLSSPKQMGNLLQLDSTAEDVLTGVAKVWKQSNDPRYETANDLLLFRQYTKAVNTYYEPILEMLDSGGFLHPNLHMTGTVAGRPSCSKPNLQAIPRYTEIYKIKDIFVARPGYILVSADYSQAEIRWGTHYAHELNMAKLLIDGADIHTYTATALKIPRDAAKRINFAVIYGVGAKTLGEELGIPFEKSKLYLSKYHKHYPGFRKLYNAAEAMASRNGYIRMFTGRIRRYDKHSPAHKASSNLIQGAVAEMLRIAITRIDATDMDVWMLLQIHDQLLLEVPDDNDTRERIATIKDMMEDFELGWDDIRIPIPVDIKVGHSWGRMEKWK